MVKTIMVVDDEELFIIDFKTNRTPYDASFTSFSTQLGMYSLASEVAFGKLAKVAYLELRTGAFTVKDTKPEDQVTYRRYYETVLMQLFDFEQNYKKHKKKGGTDKDFLMNYSHRFPVGALQVQGCPCQFLDQCIFKS
jgi:hypothetical protein